MNTPDLFATAFNLPAPLEIYKVKFKPDSTRVVELHIELSFPKGSKVACPECSAKTTVYDSKSKNNKRSLGTR